MLQKETGISTEEHSNSWCWCWCWKVDTRVTHYDDVTCLDPSSGREKSSAVFLSYCSHLKKSFPKVLDNLSRCFDLQAPDYEASNPFSIGSWNDEDLLTYWVQRFSSLFQLRWLLENRIFFTQPELGLQIDFVWNHEMMMTRTACEIKSGWERRRDLLTKNGIGSSVWLLALLEDRIIFSSPRSIEEGIFLTSILLVFPSWTSLLGFFQLIPSLSFLISVLRRLRIE